MKKKTLITFAVAGGMLILSGLVKRVMGGKCTTTSSIGETCNVSKGRRVGSAIGNGKTMEKTLAG